MGVMSVMSDAGMVNAIAVLAQGAVKDTVTFTPIPNDPTRRQVMYDSKTGDLTIVERLPDPRGYRVQDVQSMISLVRHFAGVPAEGEAAAVTDGTQPTGQNPHLPIFIWVGGNRVEAVLGEAGTRQDRITWDLHFAGGFALLQHWGGNEDGAWKTQQQMIRALRAEPGAAMYPDDLIGRLSVLKFGTKTAAEGVVGSGSEMLGRSVEAKVTGLDDSPLPDLIQLDIPVYREVKSLPVTGEFKPWTPIRWAVDCVLDVDVHKALLRIVPKANALDEAIGLAETWIIETLESAFKGVAGVKVFRGSSK